MEKILSLFVFFILFNFSFAQNTGIGEANPSEKLEVGGVIFTNQGGIKFPDSTLQTTAYSQSEINMNVIPRNYAVLTMSGLDGTFNDLGIVKGVVLLSEEAEQLQSIGFSGAGIFSQGSDRSDMNVSRNVDRFSPFFFNKSTNGSVINDVSIFFITSNGPGEEVYARIDLAQSLLAQYSQVFKFAGDDHSSHIESFSISYTAIAFTTYDANGDTCFCYDYQTNLTGNCGCP